MEIKYTSQDDWECLVLTTQTDEKTVRLFIPCERYADEAKALEALRTVAHDVAIENSTALFVSVGPVFPVSYDGNIKYIGYGCEVTESSKRLEIIPPNRKYN